MLDLIVRLNYGCKLVAMTRTPQLRLKPSALPWRVGLCLVLAALFVYNPFLTIYGTSQAQTVQRPLSWRATVASSELWRTVEVSKTLIPAVEGAPAREQRHQAATQTTKEIMPAAPRDVPRLVQQGRCNHLWFRPPPVL